MFLHWLLFYYVTFLANFKYNAVAAPTTAWGENLNLATQLTSHRFQVKLLDALITQVDAMALDYVDQFLRELRSNPKYAKYSKNFEEILDTTPDNNLDPIEVENKKSLDNKIVFIKQLLDAKSEEEGKEEEGDAEQLLESNSIKYKHHMENFYALRNVKFLKKLREHLDDVQVEVGHEMRNVKMFELCRQFRRDSENESDKLRALERTIFAHIELAPLAEELLRRNSSRQSASAPNRIRFESMGQFGTLVYGRVKQIGSEIIDDYLSTIRRLLREIITEKSEAGRREDKLLKVLHEIDAILAIEDFAKKRDRLYDYLQNNLATDYEQFKSSENGQQDLADMLMKLKQRGLDMFVRFLFSNFEFLERMHTEWLDVLHEMVADSDDAEGIANLMRLRQVHELYEDFKQDPDKREKYELYIASVTRLHEQTKAAGQDESKAFEILHNSSQNVGSVTLNMIKSKCDEL